MRGISCVWNAGHDERNLHDNMTFMTSSLRRETVSVSCLTSFISNSNISCVATKNVDTETSGLLKRDMKEDRQTILENDQAFPETDRSKIILAMTAGMS